MRRAVMLAICSLFLVSLFAGPAARAAFPGTNGLIVFGRDSGGQSDLWTVDPQTGDRTRLTDTPRKREGLADWNATGTQIAFMRCGPGEFSNCDIWVMDADGSNQARLTTTPTFQESWPAWSPDGSKIAFTTNESDAFQDVWVMDSDGTDPVAAHVHDRDLRRVPRVVAGRLDDRVLERPRGREPHLGDGSGRLGSGPPDEREQGARPPRLVAGREHDHVL